ncbi:MAG: hypothetical protein Q7T21_14980 [Gallionella sp.]|nr:hypothetical protein [Gallionella sp.]
MAENGEFLLTLLHSFLFDASSLLQRAHHTLACLSRQAGVNLAARMKNSPCRDGGTRNDHVQMHFYDGENFYLHACRGGLKLCDKSVFTERMI